MMTDMLENREIGDDYVWESQKALEMGSGNNSHTTMRMYLMLLIYSTMLTTLNFATYHNKGSISLSMSLKISINKENIDNGIYNSTFIMNV